MRPIVQEISTARTPESLLEQLRGLPRRSAAEAGEAGLVLLRSALFDAPQVRYSFVAARPFLTFRSFGSRCELLFSEAGQTHRQPLPGGELPTTCAADDAPLLGGVGGGFIASDKLPDSASFSRRAIVQFGNPWHLLDSLMARYELLDEIDLPFPLGGCFGYWGYDLKNFVEPKLPRCAINDLELPDCHVGFYDSLVVFDHRLGKTWIVSTGLCADGSRTEARARNQAEFWRSLLISGPKQTLTPALFLSERERENASSVGENPGAAPPHSILRPLLPLPLGGGEGWGEGAVSSNISGADFLAAVARAQRYIRAGDIYQVNLSQRLAAACAFSGWKLFERLLAVSPAPFAAYLDCGDFQIASSSPELFLRLSGSNIQTRPIKGTRPRSTDPTRDAQLTYELQTSAKELAELLMITDLLRNDLGKVCEFGTVQVPELMRLERYPQVQHLVSTVEGRLRTDVTHFAALASCFPGGSITGAPKFRAMEIIDELEPIARGPYTGCHGYLGFNRESQFSISIRTAIHKGGAAYFHVGAGIVADSIPAAEYDETLAKAGGFLAALQLQARNEIVPSQA